MKWTSIAVTTLLIAQAATIAHAGASIDIANGGATITGQCEVTPDPADSPNKF